ncbi:hypothetical protein [Dactylosporangium matsuzakiense]|uniref:hypothetical protein n=1 Tax=Dactylosporangium matsuzakiense TaxID=53360 RepID=UPI0022F328C4|nr:hypothetical protein [Dactylosporangium matsuzakiense]
MARRGTIDQAIEAVRIAGGGDLWLAGRRLTRVPESIRQIQHLPGVTSVNLSNNRIATVPEWIGELTGLTG